jgi:host factor-I protein
VAEENQCVTIFWPSRDFFGAVFFCAFDARAERLMWPCHNGSIMPFRNPAPDHFKKGKTPPPEETHEEAAYLKMLGEKQKPVRIKLVDGEVVKGWIEYYDRDMVRLTREGAPNLFIYKHDIRYIAEESANTKKPRSENAKAAEASRED